VSLEKYKQKRNFAGTPEPSGDGAAHPAAPSPAVQPVPAPGGRFVVQRHRARNLHYDFRLEIGGVLVSWAVPKGPTLDPAVRRAAFKVEDHPLDYFDFEGTIPAGQYGAGDVIVWDWGRFTPEATADPAGALAGGELKFQLFGEKLAGRFTIVRTHGGVGGEREQWLLIKKRDAAAVSGWETESLPRSVKTGRDNGEVAAGVPEGSPAVERTGGPSPSAYPGARPAPMPDFIEPMKATLAERPFNSPDWLFELKWDGYRVQAHVRDGHVGFFTKRGQNAATYFPELAGEPTWLAAREAILDGEVVALDSAGEPDFHLLQAWRSAAKSVPGGASAPGSERGTLAYQVFDLLYLDGYSLLDVALEDRKRLLRSVLTETALVHCPAYIDSDGEVFYAAVAARSLEGIVAKRKRGLYEPGRRSHQWLKLKTRHEQEFVICGWTPRTTSETDLGALLLGVYDEGALRFAGKVGTGFDAAERARLLAQMEPLTGGSSPLARVVAEKGVTWIQPRLVARVEFAEWPAGGVLRAPSYKGLDFDVDPAGVVRERAESSAAGPSTAPATAGRAAAGPTAIAELAALDSLPAAGGKWLFAGRELKLSNLDKPIWPADSIVKRELIRYYASIAPYLLPYLRDRSLTAMRHPDGVDKPGFWQKQLPKHAPEWITCWSLESSAGKAVEYAVAGEPATLAWLANEAAIDLHPSTFRIDAPDRPTWALIDIDPGTATSWDEVLVLTRLYRTALDHLAVKGFPKVSGRRGIQVWVPIRPGYTFDQTRDWVGGLSRAVGAAAPEIVSWEWEKSRRSGLARLDYTQNAPNKMLVAPYAVRPVAGAPVSAPISWAELDDPDLRPNRWTIRTILERLAIVGDLFAPALGLEQDLPAL
jgi:bifunctional non-homologous end joining protein LigD